MTVLWPDSPPHRDAPQAEAPAAGPALEDYRVVLLAGGFGRRLSPLTDRSPKPLLKVGTRPLLEIMIERLASQGFRRFYLCVHYRAEMIQRQIGDGGRFGVQVRYLVEETALGTAGPLTAVPERPDRPFLVMNGDLLTDLDCAELARHHAELRADATMCVREYRHQVPYGVVEASGDRLLSVTERPEQTCLINAGIYLLDPSVIDLIPRGRAFDMPALFQRLLHAGRPTAIYPIRSYWIDIGHFEDLEKANADYSLHFARREPVPDNGQPAAARRRQPGGNGKAERAGGVQDRSLSSR